MGVKIGMFPKEICFLVTKVFQEQEDISRKSNLRFKKNV